MKPKQILLVDDNPRDRELALDALSRYRAANDIIALRDGAEALDYLFRRNEFSTRVEGNPSVILLDLKMPKVDCLEVLRQIKANPVLKMVPVVMMTSSREEQDLVACYQIGVNAYVVKPLRFHEFVEAIKLLGAFWMVVNELPADP